jgi:hypothetical protein
MRNAHRTRTALTVAALASAIALGCGKPVLREGVKARTLAAALHVDFTKATDAADRAVMADTDDASENAAREARTATEASQKDAAELKTVLEEQGYAAESAELQAFSTRFDEMRKLDAEILPLAVENSNLKAQRLSFDEGQRAVDDLITAVDAAAASAPRGDAPLAASRCVTAVLQIQTLQARHIAESSDEKMDAIEQQMQRDEASAREQLGKVATLAGRGAKDSLDAARVALDTFMDDNRTIIRLSRRNTNVRSLTLSLGRKRVVIAECETHLADIDAALTAREQRAVR